MTVRTRFAPSPTGSLHVGGARTALYCWLLARQQGGRFLLRIEDTDLKRSTDEAARGILRDMEWLGLSWDDGPEREDTEGIGPFYQSQRLDTYQQWFDHLIAADVAYEAWESREELEAERAAAIADKRNFRFKRRAYSEADLARFAAEGRTAVLRLMAPDHDLTVEDAVRGRVTIVAGELEDIIIRKADGYPTYHFAVVMDDHFMGVSQVLRGAEHLMNTHKHLGLYEALAWTPPEHAHLPLIFNPTGSKMSKRDKAKAARAAAREAQKAHAAEHGHDAKDYGWLAEAAGVDGDDLARFMAKKHDAVPMAVALGDALGLELPMIEVMDFRKGGYLPQALLNYLALLGWSPGEDREIMSLTEMAALFSVERVNKSSAKFDPDKVAWMNGEYLRALSPEALDAACLAWLAVVESPVSSLDDARRAALLSMYQARIKTFRELDTAAAMFFAPPTDWDPKAVQKFLLKGGGVEKLALAAAALSALPSFTASAIDAAFEALGEAHETRSGRFAQPVRVAVAGTSVSPPIGETLAFLGRAETLARIASCQDALPTI